MSSGTAVLSDGRTVIGLHPRIVTEVNPDALRAGWDSEYLVMDVPQDPTRIYQLRIGYVDGIGVARSSA